MNIKICGLRESKNIKQIAALKPDFLGFIFYEKSKRVVKKLDKSILKYLPDSIKTVAVFVNQDLEEVTEIMNYYGFDYAQIHGNESPEYCKSLFLENIKIIKAFGIDESFDFYKLNEYKDFCEFFLFDTKDINYGGSGKTFNWEILNKYNIQKPFFLSGGIGLDNIDKVLKFKHPMLSGIDLNSKLETSYGYKSKEKTNKIIKIIHMKYIEPDNNGYYGEYGGAFIPEMLYPNVKELQDNYLEIINSENFVSEYASLLNDYAGRPTPLFYSESLSKKYSANIFIKREDLNHTGSHKLNNTLGQVLLAKKLNKKRVIAETGAGQHGVATATACALAEISCTIYMGEKDIKRQANNVDRMKLLGAEIVAADGGSKSLKDAINHAIREWINNPVDTYYLLGSIVGPHPYPDMVTRFQSVISREIKQQLKTKTGSEDPDYVIACIGGGSNAIGAFYHFINNEKTKLIAVEAGGKGVNSGKTAASITLGKKGIIHGSKTYLMQTEDGQIVEPHSVSAGLDYPGIGPAHAYLYDTNSIEVTSVVDKEALDAAFDFSKKEGIIPALESAHALAYLNKMKFKKNDVVVVNLSGRGEKDMEIYQEYLKDNNCKN